MRGLIFGPFRPWEDGDFMKRADGRTVCELCSLEYWRHPHAAEFIDHHTESPWLTALCDGRLVKL